MVEWFASCSSHVHACVYSHEEARNAIFTSYQRHINGFAAHLEEEQAAEIAKHPGVVSVFLDRPRKLHTTHSWDFMLLEKDGVVHPSSIWRKARFGEDTIIANIDTGVWPESKSFSDEGYGPIPSRWKGTCSSDANDGFTCNRKLIGARYFLNGYVNDGGNVTTSMRSPRDTEGHGTHTLSTAGGGFVPGANALGFGNGTAKGGSPKARVVAYKVCWPALDSEGGCYDSDVLHAIDMAIHDGVDVLSMSIGSPPNDYFDDGISIGAFHAVKNGIVVVCSAGNDGPTAGTVSNVSPWILTVGASTMDREFDSFIELGNGKRFRGKTLSKSMKEARLYPLISAMQGKASNASDSDALLCKTGALDPKKVKGKIVACLRGETARVDKSLNCFLAGAAGMILCNDKPQGNELEADPHFLPAAHVTYKDGVEIFAYINSTAEPVGFITDPQTDIPIKPAPFMASFSSVGPNVVTPEILKPDITAPGVDVIAAYSEAISVTGEVGDKRKSPFITMSGTSMSCPHVAGVVGLLKTLYPDWSPAAIRSAIMTTARTRDNTVNPMKGGSGLEATPFDYGTGHIRPNRAMDPGLIYDLTVNDYLDFLCAIGYNRTLFSHFQNGTYACPESSNLYDFNYPSISVPNLSGSLTLTRTVKNVGGPGIYAARIRQPRAISVSIEPRILKFEKTGEEKSFKVTLKAKAVGEPRGYAIGGLTWSDGRHYVRSPIVIAIAT
ncbi:hypothetical protein Ancab_029460 [Ancistrocladus abbreviatus]